MSSALDRDIDLFPFGTQHDDFRMEIGDDVSSDAIQLETNIAFFDEYFDMLYVSITGIVTPSRHT